MVLHQSRQDKDALIEVDRKMVFGSILKVELPGLADGLNGGFGVSKWVIGKGKQVAEFFAGGRD